MKHIISFFFDYLGNHVSTAPNEQQVFVGSLPLDFTRETLIECFSTFGKILDAKIHTPAHDNKKVCFQLFLKKAYSSRFFK